MKNKYIKFILALSFVGIFSCETVELDITKSPNQVSIDNLDPDFLFNSVQLNFAGFVENVAGVGSFTASVSRQFAMTGGNTYENAYSPSSFSGIWASAYSETLADIAALEPIATELDLKYHLGVSKLMKAYIYITLTDLFGDVPYSEALLGNANLNPVADDQIEIYKAMLNEIDEAIVLLSGVSATYPPEDFYFSDGGTVNASTQARWITAANSFKLRVLNNARLAGSDLGINISAEINAILSANNIIDTPEEDWVIQYGSNRLNPNTRHPGYTNYYEASAGGYMSNYLMWEMISEKGFDDPRLAYYFYRQDTNATNEDIFTLGCANAPAPSHYSIYTSIYEPTVGMPFCTANAPRGYWGRDHGDNGGIPPDDEKRTVYGLYPVGGSYDDGSADSAQEEGSTGQLGAGITPIITSFFMDFIKAESALTTGTTGDPAILLESGIRGSMNKVIGFLGVQGTSTTNDVDNYVAFVLDAYTNANNDTERLELIMKENHIATFGNGLEVYNAYRRTGMPSNMQPTLIQASGDFYNSALYPANYVNLNRNATQKARTERIFWDKNNITLH
ncbi:SusD/RagB family nutrient-binding outer membrane lipoprotein [Cellulophaga tyrosinoxydans]|uniref:Starch-binding associating with outer membrane n=1 Tax=Cellulophaga tyrosinoxydans TaxID=504486 RepID=A0A1W2AU71_9FLAO|nr:SusD/RagB family nutrient-binding outer membrane lipoprotein [Cellulophaga tyrosinoxydans]SMC64279.1 Starch-binding associating with outer membrane [Cellulophaga tyrosinoxydans]